LPEGLFVYAQHKQRLTDKDLPVKPGKSFTYTRDKCWAKV